MNHYKRINNLFGWIAFAISAFVYLSTIEPTGSFWDCGEFIASSYRLQVGHPPGAPLFLMLGRVFSLASGGDIRLVSVMVNILSALMSAFTILFLFWTITHLARKIFKAEEGNFSTGSLIVIFGSGLVGALAYTFSDTFWFSAVEGEVYALSSFFGFPFSSSNFFSTSLIFSRASVLLSPQALSKQKDPKSKNIKNLFIVNDVCTQDK